MLRLGYPMTRDCNDEKVLRDAGISNESNQRVKWISSKVQRARRLEIVESDKEAVVTKDLRGREIIISFLVANAKCEAKLLAAIYLGKCQFGPFTHVAQRFRRLHLKKLQLVLRQS